MDHVVVGDGVTAVAELKDRVVQDRLATERRPLEPGVPPRRARRPVQWMAEREELAGPDQPGGPDHLVGAHACERASSVGHLQAGRAERPLVSSRLSRWAASMTIAPKPSTPE